MHCENSKVFATHEQHWFALGCDITVTESG